MLLSCDSIYKYLPRIAQLDNLAIPGFYILLFYCHSEGTNEYGLYPILFLYCHIGLSGQVGLSYCIIEPVRLIYSETCLTKPLRDFRFCSFWADVFLSYSQHTQFVKHCFKNMFCLARFSVYARFD